LVSAVPDPLLFGVAVTQLEGDARVVPLGELDLLNVGGLTEAVEIAALAEPDRIVLDLARTSFIDAKGVGAVLDLAHRFAGRLAVLPAPPEIQRVFSLAQVEGQVPLGDAVVPATHAALERQCLRGLRIVQELWCAWRQGGVEAVIAVTDDDVEWTPWEGGGDTFIGHEGLRRFSRDVDARRPIASVVHHFVGLGDAVLVSGTSRPMLDGEGPPRQALWLYELENGRLVRATSHADRASALAAAVR
jgi:anti-anti-sigma regulatory factor/ketosteroid isomerase-like protein